jgi:hypothetical protein
MNHLRKLGLASFLFLGLGLFCGTSGAWLDRAHRCRKMATGAVALQKHYAGARWIKMLLEG